MQAKCILVLIYMQFSDDQLPPVDILIANNQEYVASASSVASVGLKDRANWANQMSVSN